MFAIILMGMSNTNLFDNDNICQSYFCLILFVVPHYCLMVKGVALRRLSLASLIYWVGKGLRTLTSIQFICWQQLWENNKNKEKLGHFKFSSFYEKRITCYNVLRREEKNIGTRYRRNGCVVKWISWLGVNDWAAAARQLAPAQLPPEEESAVCQTLDTGLNCLMCSVPLSPPVWCQWPTCDLTLWFTINSPWHTITHKNCSCSTVITITTLCVPIDQP